MLTVIIDARAKAEQLPVILSQLTAGAVDGLVRQVLIVADAAQAGIADLCEETGAEAHPTHEAAAGASRADMLLLLPASFRLRDGWIRALDGQAPPARVVGLGEGGLFGPRPSGLLVERRLLEQGVDHAQRLGRRLGLRRIG
ncbi:hypothetical protein [uncultured Phenylobacterium sp.]|uniref:hypothetical protein n=1 Tax=uncultured Phenylobacterium sp. TaxID=349273 RepID=UPI0025F4EC94|nr:hypothetical protein [uncultured Phenylobacterium sp.]